MSTILGIDIGGTTVKLAVVDQHRIIAKGRCQTLAKEPGENIVNRIAQAARDLLKQAGKEAVGAGVGCPGLINNRTGIVVTSANLPTFRAFPLGPSLEKALGIPVAIQNDANAAAMGEYEFSPAGKCDNLVLLTLGTGVGGGVICDGKLLVGADNAATELGHVKVEYTDPFACGCGSAGCLETYAGMNGIKRIARSVLAESGGSKLGGEPSTAEIAQAARDGDTVARRILHVVGTYIGRGVANFIDIFNPEKLILAGGASGATEFLLPGIRESLVKWCAFPMTRDRVKIEATALPDDINVLGAAAVFMNRS